jgi:hypothetical protein
MKVPTIHLNGSGRAALLDQLSTAASATGRAIESLCLAAPNGRDYDTPGDCSQARREHEARLAKLIEVQVELLELAKHVRRAP